MELPLRSSRELPIPPLIETRCGGLMKTRIAQRGTSGGKGAWDYGVFEIEIKAMRAYALILSNILIPLLLSREGEGK
jgi:hypothetical protein